MVTLLEQQHISLYRIKDGIDLQGHMNRQYLREIYLLNRKLVSAQERTNKLLHKLVSQKRSAKKEAKKTTAPLQAPKPVSVINPEFIEQAALGNCGASAFKEVVVKKKSSDDHKKHQ